MNDLYDITYNPTVKFKKYESSKTILNDITLV